MRRVKRPRCFNKESDTESSTLKQSNLDNYFLPHKEFVIPLQNRFNPLNTETAEQTLSDSNEKDKANYANTPPITEQRYGLQ